MSKLLFYIISFPIVILIADSSLVYSADSCIDCHGNSAKMKDFGYPHFTVSLAEIQAQTKMPALCIHCHEGDNQTQDKDETHKGLLTLRAVRRDWNVLRRTEMNAKDLKDWQHLEPRGGDRATQLSPKIMLNGDLKDNSTYKTFILHDKNSETLAFNPDIAMRTCGQCHEDAVKSFLKSSMGGAKGVHSHSQYITWTGRTGPQSCGLWVGALSKPNQDKFTPENVKYFNKHSTQSLSEAIAYDNQRNCNQCHVGCLDCHFSPQKKDANDMSKGSHNFIKRPASTTCYGGGRSFSCHAGPLERRRGDGYIRAEFAQASPEGKEILMGNPDIHYQKGLECIDCHESNKDTGYHADLRRNVDCGRCHSEVMASYKKGVHKKVDCASCHTTLIGGYAFNFWTSLGPKGKENPLTRIQDYTVDAVPPLIVKNPKGVWIPVHVVPHTSGNVKAREVKMSKRLLFRNRPDVDIDRRYYSNDSHAITGLVRRLDSRDNDTLVWLNLDRVAHSTGKSRDCESCHASTAQKIVAKFSGGSYKDVEDGEYTIIADRQGLRIADIKGPDGGQMPKGLEPFKDKWKLRGNFAFPKIKDKALYEKIKKDFAEGKFRH